VVSLVACAADASGRGQSVQPPSRLRARRAAARPIISDEGLVDASVSAPGVLVRLKYASPGNVLGAAVYGEGRACTLRAGAALKLASAQAALERVHPGWHLLMLDCLRPREVQRQLWRLVVGTPRQPYVARPDTGSMHNFGAAVDLSIADERGVPLDMGTAPDHFGPLAQPRRERAYLRAGKLSAEQLANRALLRKVMLAAGWRPLAIEWWHFEAFPRPYVRAHYQLVERFPG